MIFTAIQFAAVKTILMKVLWLTSWYPNQLDKFNGDFIQRHAYAASEFCKIDVIHVEGVPANALQQKIFLQSTQQHNLSETIILYKKSNLPGIGKIISYKKYKQIFKRQVMHYVLNNGVPDIVHVHVSMKAGIIALWMKKKFGVSFIITEHWSLFVNNPFNAFTNKSYLFKSAVKKIFNSAALVLPVNKKLGEAIDAITPVKFTIVYNCVNTNYFFYADRNEAQNFTFIHVSTLDINKNPASIIEAFLGFNQQYSNSNLIIAGKITPSLSKYLSKQKIPVNAIQFTGMIAYEKVARFMRQSNCLILFSQTENMPCVILEALCCGLPVITSNVGGINEVVDEENGLFVPEYNTESLQQTMTKMYENYQMYNRKNIADKAKSNFAYNIIGAEIFLKYKEVNSLL